MAKLGEVCDILNGYAFKSNQYTTSGVRIIRISNVQKGYIEDKSPVYYPCDDENVKKYELKQNDLLISLTGNVGRTALLEEKFLPAALNQRVSCIRLKETDKVLKTYLFHLLNSDYFEQQCMKAAEGVAQKNLSPKWLFEYKIPIYSIERQKEISNTLDKIALLIILRKQQLAKLDELIKARFVELFHGQGYPVLKWKDIFDTTTGKLDSNAAVENGIYPFFTCSKEVLRIDKYAFEQKALLLAGNNAAGRYDVKYYDGRFNAYQRTYVLGLKENWSYRVFQYQLEGKLEYLQQQSLGGLTKYLTLKILGELDFIIPPKDKQDEFDTFVERVDRQKQTVQKSLEKLELMKKSLMQEYFG